MSNNVDIHITCDENLTLWDNETGLPYHYCPCMDVTFDIHPLKYNYPAIETADELVLTKERNNKWNKRYGGTRGEWVLVAVHHKNARASKKNRVIGRVKNKAVHDLLEEHTRVYAYSGGIVDGIKYPYGHWPTWNVYGFDTKTGRVRVHLADDRREGLRYKTIHAATEILDANK